MHFVIVGAALETDVPSLCRAQSTFTPPGFSISGLIDDVRRRMRRRAQVLRSRLRDARHEFRVRFIRLAECSRASHPAQIVRALL